MTLTKPTAPTQGPAQQPLLLVGDPLAENSDYLSRQIITYLGNKRSLLGPIGEAVDKVKSRLGKRKLRVLDCFSGSGIVSRYLKAHASHVVSIDLELYAAIISNCYLTNKSSVNLDDLQQIVTDLNKQVDTLDAPRGFIEDLYAPEDETAITPDDRVFYTKSNARRLDNFRRMLGDLPPETRDLLLGPLLSKASIHSNTAGVFKGFYKNRSTGVGQYGGSGSDALFRIKGEITLELPVLSNYESTFNVQQGNANELASQWPQLDLAYIDPPYNQHPYGSNYFMLNLLAQYKPPSHISAVSGIPTDWQRSGYNVRSRAPQLLENLLYSIDAKFLLVSYNNEGFVAQDKLASILEHLGRVSVVEIPYNTFRGSRNLRKRSIYVTESLFLVERH